MDILEKIQEIVGFKIDDQVKLRDYYIYGDYIKRKDQPAIIVGFVSDSDLTVRIKWKDGCTSIAAPSNLKLIYTEWDL